MPFRVPLDTQVSQLSAGEKQKLEILKLLYLDQRFMILDEPTSVLTPGEADEMLGLLGGMADRKEITVLMISHKFREVKAFCDHFTVLRRGRFTGSGDAKTVSVPDMSAMMIGDTAIRERAGRKKHNEGSDMLELAGIFAEDAEGAPVVKSVQPQGEGRRDRRHCRGVGQRAIGAGRGAERAAAAGRWRHLHSRRAVRAQARQLRPSTRCSGCPRSR